MSRSEYLSIQSTIKTIELSVLEQRKKLNELKQEAEKAGVPADLME
jgi:cell division protein FtsL